MKLKINTSTDSSTTIRWKLLFWLIPYLLILFVFSIATGVAFFIDSIKASVRDFRRLWYNKQMSGIRIVG